MKKNESFQMVPLRGLEPPRGFPHTTLNRHPYFHGLRNQQLTFSKRQQNATGHPHRGGSSDHLPDAGKKVAA